MPADIAETLEADLVVVSAGNGRLVAATTAPRNAARRSSMLEGGQHRRRTRRLSARSTPLLEPDHVEGVPTLLNHANQTQAGDANILL